jgi:hypothetical protein
MIDLTNKRLQIMGLQGSGKTQFAKHLLRLTPDHLVYDPMNEYQGFTRYVPTLRNSVEELNLCIERLVIPHKPDLFIIDELNRYCPPKPTPLPTGVGELNDLSRHWGITWGGCFRRPSQVHTDLMELANYLVIFDLHGKNDGIYLDALLAGLGDAAGSLPRFHFALVTDCRTFEVHAPVPYLPTGAPDTLPTAYQQGDQEPPALESPPI